MTGAADRVDEVAKVFEQVGYHVTRATNHERLSEICANLTRASIDCYVQLPGRIEARGDSVVARVRNFLSDGLIRRFDAAATVLPALRPDGSVLPVAGNHPADSTGPDDQRARLSLLSVLAHALVTERGGTGLTVTITLGFTASYCAELCRCTGITLHSAGKCRLVAPRETSARREVGV